MRIIILTSSTNRSGGTRQALYQARGLAERGHEVTLCLPENSSLWKFAHDPLWRPLPKDPRGWRKAVEGLLPAGPAIVHAFHNKAVKCLAWWGLFWRKRGVACVAHRGVIFRPNNILPYLSPAIRAFAVNSQACARSISLFTPKSKIRVVPNAVPDERVTPSLPPDEIRRQLDLAWADPCFVYIGNDSEIKGADLLLRSFAAAKLPRAGLVMIGTTPELWRRTGEELGIAGQVRHLGHVEEVANYLQIGDAFVFPTSMDSSPNTLLEAIRMGLPVVATTVGGVPEIARGNGILVPPQDEAALARALADMAANPAQRAAWGRVSLELGAVYSVSARCEALEALYQSLLPPL